MRILQIANNTNSRIKNNNHGSALLITVLILTSILAVALGAANLVVSGIKMSGGQERSTIAYFAAEAGAERVLWNLHYGDFSGCNLGEYVKFGAAATCDTNPNPETLSNNSSYSVYYKSTTPLAITSTGGFANVKRIVELGFD
ncbi:pilus assembly PilX N-terminal domain-containing protein [Candidatus Parcubacteria bacterium]|nr:pilus assembly PilX N-terminal domain-containing protein [Patescibacteria group bacterium]MBU4347145.1 pilus assembly PilX N-terminal domain-containing protein [Patescibacteria group bacterium]MCG2691052.1 pilus assembly PilX N-terminal domain-containing protein [Candidatus Parcubacteria bacterium]